jgi:hypothetical protein
MSIDDDRSACADTWKFQFSEAVQPEDQNAIIKSKFPSGGELINNGIEPNTL